MFQINDNRKFREEDGLFSHTTGGLGIGHVTERRVVTFVASASRPPLLTAAVCLAWLSVVCEKKSYSSKTKLAPSTLLTRSNG